MTKSENYIQYYNSLNGKTVSVETLKKFYDRLCSTLNKSNVNGHKEDLEKIKKRVVQGIFSAGAEKKVRVELSPIAHHAVKKTHQVIINSEDVSVSRSLLHGLEKIPYNKIKDYQGGGLGFTNDGQQKIYDMITEMVLKTIKKEKELPWRKPWKIDSILATNFVTKTVYQGANLFLLNLIAPLLFGKVGPYWMTFKQIKKLGGKVKAGSQAFPVIYYSVYYLIRKPERKTITKEQFDALTPDQVKEKEAIELWTINYYNVFPQEDIEGIEFPSVAKKRKGASVIDAAENIVKAMPQRPDIIHHNTGRAFYSPSEDHIKLPPIEYFHQDQEYYSTLFHELIHATGHESRLDRFEANKETAGTEGKKEYAYEELIAELGASYLNAESGILYFTLKNSAAYLKGWTKKLEDVMTSDNKFFLKASAKAAQAANFILDRKTEVHESEGEGQARKDAKKVKRKEFKAKSRGKSPKKKSTKKGRGPIKKKLKSASVPGVKASVGKAIEDLVETFPKKYGKKAMAMSMLYSTFHNDTTDAVKFDTSSLKFKLLEKEKWIDFEKSGDTFARVDHDWYTINESGKEVIASIDARLQSLRVKKQGGELFPDLKGIGSGLGFITSDMAPEKSGDTFTLPGPIGEILGQLQRYKLEIVISGEPHSGKSELGKQIADAFISKGDDVAWLDWEQGGLQSTLTQESIDRCVKPENKKHLHVSSEVPKTLEAVKSLAHRFKVIGMDSGTKLKQFTNEWIDELREQYPHTVWIILMQQNTRGGTRGGAAAEFDSPVVLKTYRPDESDYKKNYAHLFKNRGNKTGQYYLIADKKIIKHEPGKEPEGEETLPVHAQQPPGEVVGIEEKTISI